MGRTKKGIIMDIPIKELQKVETYVTHTTGYRIVYFYEIYHEAPQGLYAKEISDFMKYFKKGDIVPKFISNEDILERFLEINKQALGVAIYNIEGKLIIRKNKENICKINNSEVYKEELIYDFGDNYFTDGYRIVYLYDDRYDVDDYSKTLEGFMTRFAYSEPILDESDIPEFISVEDLLTRFLEIRKDAIAVALYKMDGTCISMYEKKSPYSNNRSY